jgi:Arc/MetJ-type ribon-helix-helix transcriptional regulator
MTITVVLKNEAAEIVERHVSEGRYPDAESAVTAALALLEDTAVDWSDVDAAAVERLIAHADDEGGELTRDDVAKHLERTVESAQHRG